MVTPRIIIQEEEEINCLVPAAVVVALQSHPFLASYFMLKLFCVFGAVLGFLGVAAGSFGAHGLKDLLEANGQAANWETAVRYCLFPCSCFGCDERPCKWF